MMHPSWAADGSRRAILVNRGYHDVCAPTPSSPPPSSPTPPPSPWGRSWWRPSTPPPPPARFFTSTSWVATAGDLPGTSRVVYTPSPTSPVLLRPGSRLRELPSWSQDLSAGTSTLYQRTSTSTSSLASSPPSESFSTSTSPPRSVLAPTAGRCSAFREYEGSRLPQRDLPAFGERTASAASATFAEAPGSPAEMSTSSAFLPLATNGLESPTAIDNLVALTRIMCLTDEREERSATFDLAKRNNFMGRKKSLQRPNIYCAFCKGNGELRALYSSHRLHVKLPDGSFRVQCPVLRNLRCEICGANGDNAHTKSHCPNNTQPSVAVMLKKTPRRSDGAFRYNKKF
ncbi:Nanos-like protein 2 [Frankliniella fusca]|uniref:Nanos-like protein 2 n=1 Tax=Frankliniella fusca TaxID=407009 RepID=A0AAE1HGU8_9NEOP|nr:Nanos-like protein 2 [Frankliniella fusca]